MVTVAELPVAPERSADIDERVAFLRQFEAAPTSVSLPELVMATLALGTWFGLFAGGLLVGTETYRSRIMSPEGVASAFTSWLIVLSFWTITNIGLLACVSSYLGAFGRRARFIAAAVDGAISQDLAMKASITALWTYYASAVMRGFGVYTLSLAGLLVLATQSLLQPSQEDYLRLAPLLSIISFYGGYDSTVFAGMLGRVKAFVDAKPGVGK
ncbi:MAG: hypothetical protein SFV23_24645 [Planctomycetaceae bacterium]|nr:hypothetical protein [Planctomycetaceae bacterium]